jgi:hypothetical protein
METADIFRIFAVVSLALTALLGIVSPLIFRGDRRESISQSIAKNNRYFVSAGVGLSLLGLGFCSGLLIWYIPSYHLSVWAYGLSTLAFIGILGLAWVRAIGPSERSMRINVHFAFGQLLGVSLILLLFMVQASGRISLLLYALNWLTLAFCMACFPLYIFVKKLRQHFLLFEIAFGGLLILSFALLGLIGPK